MILLMITFHLTHILYLAQGTTHEESYVKFSENLDRYNEVFAFLNKNEYSSRYQQRQSKWD